MSASYGVVLTGLGFKDTDSNGYATWAEQTPSVNHEASFNYIAGLDGSVSSISEADINILTSNPAMLAKVIRHEASFTNNIFYNSRSLQQGVAELPRDEPSPAITPVEYKRLVTLMQLGLDLINDPQYDNFTIFGTYGPQTASLITYLKTDMNLGSDGSKADINVFGALLLHLENPKEGVRQYLNERATITKGDHYFDNCAADTKKNVVAALKYIYPADFQNSKIQSQKGLMDGLDTNYSTTRDTVLAILVKRYGTALINSTILADLANKLDI